MREVVVEGPCVIKVLEGRVKVVGIPVEKGEELKLPPRTFTVVVEDNTKFQTDCRALGEVNLGWEKVAEEIARSGGRVLVLGAIDSGKTYFSTLLSNLSASYFVDGDVGQSSLFLPGFIASTKLSGKRLTLEAKAEELEFFGGITPSLNYRLHANLVSSLVSRGKERLIIVDTDGWFKGVKAMLHKFELTLRVDPDFVVVFDERIREKLPSPYRQRAVAVKGVGLSKDPERRRKNRAQKFREYFSQGRVHLIPLEDFLGERVSDVLLNAWGDYVQLVDETPCVGYRIDVRALRGALLGVVRKGKVVGAGLLLDVEEKAVKFLSRAEEADGVILGTMSLTPDFEERAIQLEKC
ncbi:MAG: hypothetical protein ASUL_07934 [Candidatus Aramenus sulfurataquae]|jgi:polynucleotide 5'-kinase involved in rRNA processing|uniref:polynucleotide 5'-hydroxyl-kinase n=3 Tax=Candidatus Aramenus sulfurataquae TaxID=1326980 RepID=W7KU18_9CREN|nr:MAG: hypothetical protein ASUL_07934 [Candidatus Aramenus sulfurataquae]MCL7344461.1 GTPase [Candidatus Aramenus sulfurataquae]